MLLGAGVIVEFGAGLPKDGMGKHVDVVGRQHLRRGVTYACVVAAARGIEQVALQRRLIHADGFVRLALQPCQAQCMEIERAILSSRPCGERRVLVAVIWKHDLRRAGRGDRGTVVHGAKRRAIKTGAERRCRSTRPMHASSCPSRSIAERTGADYSAASETL